MTRVNSDAMTSMSAVQELATQAAALCAGCETIFAGGGGELPLYKPPRALSPSRHVPLNPIQAPPAAAKTKARGVGKTTIAAVAILALRQSRSSGSRKNSFERRRRSNRRASAGSPTSPVDGASSPSLFSYGFTSFDDETVKDCLHVDRAERHRPAGLGGKSLEKLRLTDVLRADALHVTKQASPSKIEEKHLFFATERDAATAEDGSLALPSDEALALLLQLEGTFLQDGPVFDSVGDRSQRLQRLPNLARASLLHSHSEPALPSRSAHALLSTSAPRPPPIKMERGQLSPVGRRPQFGRRAAAAPGEATRSALRPRAASLNSSGRRPRAALPVASSAEAAAFATAVARLPAREGGVTVGAGRLSAVEAAMPGRLLSAGGRGSADSPGSHGAHVYHIAPKMIPGSGIR